MELRDEEKRMLGGDFGEAVQYSMDILVKIGEMYGAEHLTEIHSAHVGVAYPEFLASVELAESFSNKGGKFKILTTVNTVHWPGNFNRWPDLHEPAEYLLQAERALNATKKMGGILTCSCVPYFQGNLPKYGESVAWTESSAISFANSVLGARANRITEGLDKAAAITGRMPCFGFMLKENRKGNCLVKMEFIPKCLTDYGTIGYIVGKYFGDKIPVIEGLAPSTTTNDLKVLGAAAASSGAVALYHCVGLTPEARTRKEALGGGRPELEIKIGHKEIADAIAEINTARSDDFDAVLIGCPHPSISEIKDLALLLEGKKVRKDIKFWIFVSSDVLELAREQGYNKIIEESGAEFVERDCIVFFHFGHWGWKNVMTDSAKFANLLPVRPNRLDVIYADRKHCVDAATGKL